MKSSWSRDTFLNQLVDKFLVSFECFMKEDSDLLDKDLVVVLCVKRLIRANEP